MRTIKHKLYISAPAKNVFLWFKNLDNNYID